MNTICALCHVTNSVPEDHLADSAKCGRCGHELFCGGVISATATTLNQLRQGGPACGGRLLGILVQPMPQLCTTSVLTKYAS